MAYRMVLVGMRVSGKGPQIRPTGRERRVRITHLSSSEAVVLRQGTLSVEYSTVGVHPWMGTVADPYHFEKFGQGSPTIVEVDS